LYKSATLLDKSDLSRPYLCITFSTFMNYTSVNRLIDLILFVLAFLWITPVISAQDTEYKELTDRLILDGNAYPDLRELLLPRLENKPTAKEQLYLYNRLSRIDNILGNTLQSREWANKAALLINETSDSLLIYEHRLTLCEAKMSASAFTGLLPELENIRLYTQKNNLHYQHKRVLTLLGTLYFLENKHDQSLRYLQEALQVAQQIPAPYNTTIDKINITIPTFILNKEKAISQVLKHLEEAQGNNDTISLTMAYLVLGQYYLQNQQTDQWEEILEKTIQFTAQSRFTVVYQLVANQQLTNYINKEKYQEAIQLGNKLLNDTRINEFNTYGAMHLDSLMYLAYLGVEDNQKAIFYLKNYYEKALKQKESSHLRELDYLQAQHELDEKNLLISKSKLQIKQQKKRFIILLLASLFIITLLSFIIIFKILKQRYTRQLFIKERAVDKLLQQEVAPDLEQNDRSELYNDMIRLIEEERLYLNPQLDQKMLVSLLHTNKQYLYEAISQHQDANFKHIINQYRVQEAKRMMEKHLASGKSFGFDAIYLDAGFNSITSYYRAFKTFTGLTPKEYLNELQQELKEKQSN
jgi:AraC-like DNA-binding protein